MKIIKHRGETITLATTVGFAQTRGIPPNMNAAMIEVPSATLENISIAFTPKIERAWRLVGTTYTDVTANFTGRNAANTVAINSFATSSFLYIGCRRQFRGISVDITNTNSTVATGLAEYYKSNATWATLSFTDNTVTGGNTTFGQDGTMTWTVPTDWITTTVNSEPQNLYWMRYSTGTAFDASVSIAGVSTLLNTTTSSTTTDFEGDDYMLIRSKNDAADPYIFYFNPEERGGFEVKSTSITSAMNVTWLQCVGGY